MKYLYRYWSAFSAIIISSIIAAPSQAESLPEANIDAIKAHLTFLSHDELRGRETGTPGHEIASLYIASQFQQYGLKPKGENGTYFQRVNFRHALIDQDSPALTLTVNGKAQALDYPKQYITSANQNHPEVALSGDIVFVGYGIVAPELKHDDYAGLDVKGKIVAMLSGKPKFFPSEEGAHFASGRQKTKYAVERGAKGIITVSTPVAEKIRPYKRYLTNLHAPSLRWLKADGTPASTHPELLGGAYFSQEAAKVLFEKASTSLEDIYAMLEEDKVPKGFPLNASMELSSKSAYTTISSPNVVGLLEGSDPELKHEYVVFTAHSDHTGIAKSVKKDRINNGAMDNASGTAVLLETARVFSQMPAPKRSILFVAVTAEEKGLLGSDYFAQNPTVPVTSMVANINLDMPILLWDFVDVIAFGANHSDLSKTVSNAAQRLGLKLSPDPWPEQAIFTRSDHYSFVKQGVPSVFLAPGLATAESPDAGAKIFAEFFATRYHMPADEFHDDFNNNAIKKFADVNVMIGDEVANQERKPAWNQGDFFGDTFKQPVK
ncbi:M28 family metallopeptidase [Alteromonas sp. a30]|uniref:M28 family metallopeptidase n=1 Tax=Alteromonas sp. a30 TaxID=2730917 RepID=UPI00227DFB24|nr:M28 family metallopeptidase [Alteromonas sp. a30]MCY7295771.1 M28 family peptidase [Alteromonas sp. a30]